MLNVLLKCDVNKALIVPVYLESSGVEHHLHTMIFQTFDKQSVSLEIVAEDLIVA